MATTSNNINIPVDNEVKAKAQELFSALGLDMASAINAFLRQAIRKNGIPFEMTLENQEAKKTPKFGSMRGEMWMADDWDEPLEDFKEYMLGSCHQNKHW